MSFLFVSKDWLGITRQEPISKVAQHLTMGVLNWSLSHHLTSRGLEFSLLAPGYENFSPEDIERMPATMRAEYLKAPIGSFGTICIAPDGRCYRSSFAVINEGRAAFVNEFPTDMGEVYVFSTEPESVKRVLGFMKGCGPTLDVDRLHVYLESKSLMQDVEVLWFPMKDLVKELTPMYADLKVGERPKPGVDLMQYRYTPKRATVKYPTPTRAAKKAAATPKPKPQRRKRGTPKPSAST